MTHAPECAILFPLCSAAAAAFTVFFFLLKTDTDTQKKRKKEILSDVRDGFVYMMLLLFLIDDIRL